MLQSDALCLGNVLVQAVGLGSERMVVVEREDTTRARAARHTADHFDCIAARSFRIPRHVPGGINI